MITKQSKILITGASGLLGSTIARELRNRGYTNLLTPSHEELDLTNGQQTFEYFYENSHSAIIHCAGLVGGIESNNNNKADYLYANAAMGLNVVRMAQSFGIKKLINFGSVCMYPCTDMTLSPSMICTGQLEPTNEAYAIALITVAKLCQYYSESSDVDYVTLIPCNLYHPLDRSTHIIPDLIRKLDKVISNGEEILKVYGTGAAVREFIHTEDCARDTIYVLESEKDNDCYINITSQTPVPIKNIITKLVQHTYPKPDIKYTSELEGCLKRVMVPYYGNRMPKREAINYRHVLADMEELWNSRHLTRPQS